MGLVSTILKVAKELEGALDLIGGIRAQLEDAEDATMYHPRKEAWWVAGDWRDVEMEAVVLFEEGGGNLGAVQTDAKVHKFNSTAEWLDNPFEFAATMVHCVNEFLEAMRPIWVDQEDPKDIIDEASIEEEAV